MARTSTLQKLQTWLSSQILPDPPWPSARELVSFLPCTLNLHISLFLLLPRSSKSKWSSDFFPCLSHCLFLTALEQSLQNKSPKALDHLRFFDSSQLMMMMILMIIIGTIIIMGTNNNRYHPVPSFLSHLVQSPPHPLGSCHSGFPPV